MKAEAGIAIRSTVFPPHLILSIVPEFDSSFSAVWFPSVGARFDALDMCGLALGASRRLNAGTGVIRLHEQDLGQLASRGDTLSQGSQDRFILGVGTGPLVGRAAVDQLVDLTRRLRASYPKTPRMPVYFAALGPRMVRAAFENADGVLLNFCSPGYASSVISRVAGRKKDGFRIACYVKLFFAEDENESRRMLADEFVNYDSLPQYHKMFEAMRIEQLSGGFQEPPRGLRPRHVGRGFGNLVVQPDPGAGARAPGEVQGSRRGLTGGIPVCVRHRRLQAQRSEEIARLAEVDPYPRQEHRRGLWRTIISTTT